MKVFTRGTWLIFPGSDIRIVAVSAPAAPHLPVQEFDVAKIPKSVRAEGDAELIAMAPILYEELLELQLELKQLAQRIEIALSSVPRCPSN